MSIWKDFFEEDFNSLNYPNHNKIEYIKEHIENFVGTKKQIQDEEIRLAFEYTNIYKELRREYNEAVNKLEDAWKEKLYREYLGEEYPIELHNKIYAQAYEDGHSSGWSEVENYYIHLSSVFEDVFNLGFHHGKES